jgi:hypothetical protein
LFLNISGNSRELATGYEISMSITADNVNRVAGIANIFTVIERERFGDHFDTKMCRFMV